MDLKWTTINEMKKVMNLFIETLNNFQQKTDGLPVRFNRCIALWYFTNFEIKFDLKIDSESIDGLSNYIFKISKSHNELIVNLYLHLIYIDNIFIHLIKNSKEYAKICSEMAKDSLQQENDDYWLFDLPPKSILSENDLKIGMVKSQRIWKSETKLLRQTVKKFALFLPNEENALNLSFVLPILEGEKQ